MQDDTFMLPGHLEVIDRGNVYARDCPARKLLDRIGDKWSVLILLLLGDGELRFSVLKRRIDGISQKMISQTLRSLERDGLVLRRVEQSVPVSVSYAITPLARGLLTAMQGMIDWAETAMPMVEAAQRQFDDRLQRM